MAASRVPPFPLVIICLLLIRGSFSLPTTSGLTGKPQDPSGSSTKDLWPSTEDYNNLEEEVTPIAPIGVSQQGGIPQRCNYDPCREGQVSCAALAAANKCLCPGSTLHNVPPEAPSLKSVAWNGSQVVIKWCAPNSFVESYRVTVGGQERQTFEKGQRSGTVGDLDHIAKVCVIAVNDSGASDESCLMYHPRDTSVALKAGLIGGALGFLLLVLLAVLLWRHRRQRKQEASISMQDTAGAQ